jgi:hypothetical protein
MRSCCLDT